ncbi:MAG: MaoC family dehydratase [Pseudomonadota bacterium]
MPIIQASDVQSHVGKEVGVSDWREITQAGVNAFADVTGDHQFIHVDPEKAKLTPIGGTIAHGFYTLSLLAGMADGVTLRLDTLKMGLNYGLDRVRFIAPVKVGARIRARFTLASVDRRNDGAYQFTYTVAVEIEGEDKPALAAQWVFMQYV